MATTTTIKLREFNLDEALSGATLAFSDIGSVLGKVSNYVLNFQRTSEGEYVGYVNNMAYKFNSTGGCFDGILLHKLFIVDAQIDVTSGTAGSRNPGSGVQEVDINSLQPREHFAIAALKGIMYHMTNPLALDDAAITLITTKAFEIAQGMMSAAADARAEASGDAPPTEDKKEEVEVNPDELTSMSDKILYNIYVQNNNKAIDEKSRFDVLTGAEYNDNGVLEKVGGLKIYADDENPLLTKLHEDSKIAEVVKITEVTKVSELTKITDNVNVTVEGPTDVNIASSDTILQVSGDVDVNNTVEVSGNVGINSAVSTYVVNLPGTFPVTGHVDVSGSTVSVDNLPDSGGNSSTE